jgi:membrane-bound serine protease (ClpP class)
VLGLGLLASEMFVPGAIVGSVGFILVLVAIGSSFYQSETVSGVLMVLISVVAIPAGVMFILPRLSMKVELKREDGLTEGTSERGMMGRVGRTVSPLRPVGTAEFDGERVSVQAEHGLIDAGQAVTVVRVEGNSVFVRPVNPG